MSIIRIGIILCLSFAYSKVIAQKNTVYLFPGQGSDYRIFDSIQFNSSYSVVLFSI